MPQQPVQLRDLVRDNRDRLGIVVARYPGQPGRKWLEEQFDERMRDPDHRVWWNVMPLDGGLVIVPDALLHFVRPATFDDALQAVSGGNEAAVKTLIGLFPSLVEYARALNRGEA